MRKYRDSRGVLQYPGVETWTKAFSLFLLYKPLKYISMVYNIPYLTLRSYSVQHEWDRLREEATIAGQQNAVATLRKLQDANLVEVASRHLNLTQKIDEHIDLALSKPKVGARQLKDLSTTLSNSAEVSGRVTGLTRLTSQDAGKPLLVQFNIKVDRNAVQVTAPESPPLDVPSESSPLPDTTATVSSADTESSPPDPF